MCCCYSETPLHSITDDTLAAIGPLKFPVLDLYAENDLPQVLKNTTARTSALKKIKNAKQVILTNTNHFYDGEEETLLNQIETFLDETIAAKK